MEGVARVEKGRSSKSRKEGRKLDRPPVGTGRFVYEGGSNLYAGILGRVNTIYKKDVIKHDFLCPRVYL